MYDYQSTVLRSASQWSEATALVVLGAGLLYTLHGFRFARFLLAALCAAGGLVLGGILAALAGLPATVSLISAAALGVAALLRQRTGLALGSAFTLGTLIQYLGGQLGLSGYMLWMTSGAGLPLGFSLRWVCRRALPILVTIIPGSGLLVVGFVGLTNRLAPSLGLTFLDWAESFPLMVPGFMLMLCVLGYSVQANAMQGDIETGGAPGLSDPGAT